MKRKTKEEENEEKLYEKLSESLAKKGVVSAMLNLPTTKKVEIVEKMEDLKIERDKELKTSRKKEVKIEKVKKNFFLSKDAIILLEAMATIENKTRGKIIEEAILEKFIKVFQEYDEFDKELFKRKFFPEISENTKKLIFAK